MTLSIEVASLQKVYGGFRRDTVHALRGVSLWIEQGTIFGLIGQNGAGKTTLIKILLGLSDPTDGSARVLGSSPRDAETRRRLGYLPEQMRLPDYFTASDFLRYMGKLNGIGSLLLRKRIEELLEKVGLAGNNKPVRAYSKGMQQRLGLAQALINDPELLFLDEPTDGLDPLGRKDVRDLVVALRAEGKTIFLNSHLLSEVELICDQIAILDRGHLARMATPADFTRGTGEYLLRVAAATDSVRASVANVLGDEVDWQQNTFRFVPRDLPHLNHLIDTLRSVPVQIEAVEPIRLSLEEFFIDVVAERPANVGNLS